MSEPYEPHFKRCKWCGADVTEDLFNKDTDACYDCLKEPT